MVDVIIVERGGASRPGEDKGYRGQSRMNTGKAVLVLAIVV
jgi:hypothetical protein